MIASRPLPAPVDSIPIHAHLNPNHGFAHGACDRAQNLNLTARELSMLRLMNVLTEKADWHVGVFRDDIVAAWREEARSMPLISDAVWEWCLAELRDKAAGFAESGRVVVLNGCCGVSKSDTAVSASLREEVVEGVRLLRTSLLLDSHVSLLTDSRGRMESIVDTALFPLVYGRTRVNPDGDQVDLNNPLGSCGRDTIAPRDINSHRQVESRRHSQVVQSATVSRPYEEQDLNYSTNFQQLPCEVQFTGHPGVDVRITSYINNLHPTHHRSLYGTLENLISASIQPWNDVLVMRGRDRWPARIKTWGIERGPNLPAWTPDLFGVLENREGEDFHKVMQQVEDYLALPEDTPCNQLLPRLTRPNERTIPPDWRDTMQGPWEAVQAKRARLYHWKHPEAGEAFTYQQWKDGDTSNAIINRAGGGVKAPHEYYSVALEETFRTDGLQVLVQLSSIELTPEKPTLPSHDWHFEGMLNEHIVATSIYFYDVGNVTDPVISFRQETLMEQADFDDDASHAELAAVFAVEESSARPGERLFYGHPSRQVLGSITTPQGRLVAWPNTLQNKLERVSLVDRTRPGHCRFVLLSLVDPQSCIYSTRHVPPQQHDWWAEEALAVVACAQPALPPEILDMVRQETEEEWPMRLHEAVELREELMRERTAAEDWREECAYNYYDFQPE